MQSLTGIDPIQFIARVVAFATAIPFHEAAHGWVSEKLGDPTARNAGRITLNPLKHLDPWGTLAMILIGFGWAKPVPIDTRYYKNRRAGMAISSAAGPISNLLLAYVNMIIYKLMLYGFFAVQGLTATMPQWYDAVVNIFNYLVIINVVLAVFNLMPIPPFDGSRIFWVFLPEKWYFAIQKYERIIMGVMLLLLFFGAFSGVLSTAYGYVLQAFDWLTGYIDLIFVNLLL